MSELSEDVIIPVNHHHMVMSLIVLLYAEIHHI